MRKILEAKSSPIYHGTGYEEAYKILKSNKLIANKSNYTETVGVSFTRNPREAYYKVSLVIDQEKLNYNYKIHPVYRNGIAGKDLAEERVDKTIENIRKYIIRITSNNPMDLRVLRRILVNNYGNHSIITMEPKRGKDFDAHNRYYLYELIKLAEKLNIPIDKQLKDCKVYIEKFLNDERDSEKEKEMAEKLSRKKISTT